MDSRFESQKAAAMEKLRHALDSGSVDEGILPLLEFINSLDEFYPPQAAPGGLSSSMTSAGTGELVAREATQGGQR